MSSRRYGRQKADLYPAGSGYYEQKYKETGDITLMPELIYHFENANDMYKKYEYKLEYFKEFFSGTQEIYPAMSLSFTDKFFFPDLDSSRKCADSVG